MREQGRTFSPIGAGNVYLAQLFDKDGKLMALYGGSAGSAGKTCAEGFAARFAAREAVMVSAERPSKSDSLSSLLRELQQSKKAPGCRLVVNIFSLSVPEGRLMEVGDGHGAMLFAESALIAALWTHPLCINARNVAFAVNGRMTSEEASRLANRCVVAGCLCSAAGEEGCSCARHAHLKLMTVTANMCVVAGCLCSADGEEGCSCARHAHLKLMTVTANRCVVAGCLCSAAGVDGCSCSGHGHFKHATAAGA